MAPIERPPTSELLQAALIETPEDRLDPAEAPRRARRSERSLRAAFSNAGVGISQVDLRSRHFVRVNRKFSEIVGYSPRELYRLSPTDITHPDDVPRDLEAMEGLLAGRIDSYSTEKRFLRKDGSPVWVSLNVSAMRDEAGQTVETFGVVQDITERRQRDEALAIERERLRLALEGAKAGVWEWDIQQDFVTRSEQARALYGIGPSDRSSLGAWLDSVHPEDSGRAGAAIQAVLDGADRYELEFRTWGHDGDVRWFLNRAKTIYDEDGRPARLVGIAQDITERKRTEEALRLSEERYRSLISATSSIVWTVNPAGEFVEPQTSWEAYTGQPWEEHRGFGWVNAFHPEDRGSVKASWEAARDSRLTYTSSGRLWHAATREYRRFEAKAAPIFASDDTVREWVGTCVDVHERWLAERALSEAEASLRSHQERLNLALQASDLGVWHANLPLQRLELSPPARRHYGLSLEEPVTLELLLSKLHPQDRPGTQAAIQRSIQDCAHFDLFHRVVAPEGQTRWIRAMGTTLVDEAGSATGFDGVTLDLTERVRHEQRLRESEERFRLLAEASPSFIWMSDATGRLLFMSPRWTEYTGIPSDEAGERWESAAHPEDLPPARAIREQANRDGSPFRTEFRLRHGATGAYRWFMAQGTPQRDTTGKVIRWVGVTTDIHDQKTEEERLERLVRERTADLEAANREMEGFTYSVSHDLRGPLRSIIAGCRMLQDDFGTHLPPEAWQHLDRQARAARHMGALIDDLLRLSRLGRQELHRRPIDLSEMAEEVAEEVRGSAADCPVEFLVEPGLATEGDPKLVRLVLINLLENARKFSPEGGCVQVGRDSDSGEFYVRDEGIGFEPQYANKVFLPFERLVRDDQYPGTGIGLANVKRIIERHRGTCRAHSEGPGSGATFYFRLGE